MQLWSSCQILIFGQNSFVFDLPDRIDQFWPQIRNQWRLFQFRSPLPPFYPPPPFVNTPSPVILAQFSFVFAKNFQPEMSTCSIFDGESESAVKSGQNKIFDPFWRQKPCFWGQNSFVFDLPDRIDQFRPQIRNQRQKLSNFDPRVKFRFLGRKFSKCRSWKIGKMNL